MKLIKKILIISCVLLLCACKPLRATDSSAYANSDSAESKVNYEGMENTYTVPESGKVKDAFNVNIAAASCPEDDDEFEEFYFNTEWFLSENWQWPNTEAPRIEPSDSDIPITGQFSEGFPIVNNEVDIFDTVYPCDGMFVNDHYFYSQYTHNNYINSKKTMRKNYDTLNYPIVVLRKIGDGKYYDVRKYRYGGYLYSFYDMEFDMSNGKYATEDESFVNFIGGVYMENVLSYSAFADIKIGNTIDDVGAVDSATAMYKLCAILDECENSFSGDPIWRNYQENKAYSLHLLTDGLLTIHYDKIDGEYIVADIVFSEDFIYESPFLIEQYGNSYPKQFKILPQDYPPVD